MKYSGVGTIAGAGIALAVGVLLAGRTSGASAQAPTASPRAPNISHLADGKPDLNGIWQVRNTAYADLQDHPARLLGEGKSARLFVAAGLGVVEGNDIPYVPAMAAKKRENFARQESDDPMTNCYMAGVPRAMYLPVPFEIAQSAKHIAVISEYSHSERVIYLDGSKHPEGITFWMGDSRGRWEGDTLVVDVANMNDKTWFDLAGNFHSDALHVVERLSLADADTLRYEATIEDPAVFTRPWKISMPMYRVKPAERPELLEYECAGLLREAAGLMINPSEEPPPSQSK